MALRPRAGAFLAGIDRRRHELGSSDPAFAPSVFRPDPVPAAAGRVPAGEEQGMTQPDPDERITRRETLAARCLVFVGHADRTSMEGTGESGLITLEISGSPSQVHAVLCDVDEHDVLKVRLLPPSEQGEPATEEARPMSIVSTDGATSFDRLDGLKRLPSEAARPAYEGLVVVAYAVPGTPVNFGGAAFNAGEGVPSSFYDAS